MYDPLSISTQSFHKTPLLTTKTQCGGTQTTEGFIAHKQLLTDLGLIDYPVMIDYANSAEIGDLPTPKRDAAGRFLYAYPGCAGATPHT
ncbi:hypothetical protein PLUTO_00720 [Luteibacter phage vB_LflM-Pluto]|uniref:Uncharacterized protein n=1 Tax=Luteibacter phage vB_LflM-Pluto TaxID=2948611 RepID=A0A9E7SL90_9CAUD|nr:hypothetical protein PLUTO_00720 [Luteibacter phage vB_LflM-Pluto]